MIWAWRIAMMLIGLGCLMFLFLIDDSSAQTQRFARFRAENGPLARI